MSKLCNHIDANGECTLICIEEHEYFVLTDLDNTCDPDNCDDYETDENEYIEEGYFV